MRHVYPCCLLPALCLPGQFIRWRASRPSLETAASLATTSALVLKRWETIRDLIRMALEVIFLLLVVAVAAWILFLIAQAIATAVLVAVPAP
ncbi:MAG: hypothetical protein RMK29_22205 [Myxococcales bacterium]|nr:hypothetical protein [Myxococcota bacterium]MDW8284429.1 hypothetical protein [Myxococcales bacterium]